jgi:hypothetical protein
LDFICNQTTLRATLSLLIKRERRFAVTEKGGPVCGAVMPARTARSGVSFLPCSRGARSPRIAAAAARRVDPPSQTYFKASKASSVIGPTALTSIFSLASWAITVSVFDPR